MARCTRLVAAVALISISMLASEGILRIADHYIGLVHAVMMPPWERVSPIVTDTRLGARGNPYHPDHDRAGYRNAAVLRQADVVVLGDSHAYGAGVQTAASWPQRINQRVYNMALPSYGPGHYLLQLNDALALRPRLVVIAPYFGNDFVDTYLLARRHPELLSDIAPSLRAAAAAADTQRDIEEEVSTLFAMGATPSAPATGVRAWVSDHVKLYALARSAWTYRPISKANAILSRDFTAASAALTPIQRRYASPVDTGQWRTILTPAYRARALDDMDPRVRIGFESARASLGVAHKRCQAAGVAVLIVLHPTKESVFWPRIRDRAAHIGLTQLVTNEQRLREELLEWLANRRIPTVDLLQALRAAPTQPYFEDVDGHPNEAGHAIIAQVVANYARPLFE